MTLFPYLFTFLFACVSFCSCNNTPDGEGGPEDRTGYYDPITVGTYNIQYNNRNDAENLWENRRIILEELLDEIDFDIFGAQEPYKGQIADMMEFLGDTYAVYGKDRTGGTTSGRDGYNPIFYKKERFTILDDGMFWLSETPDVANSKGWDANQVRMCCWIKFSDKVTGKEFYHFNCHFDHIGETARMESAKLAVSRITSIAGNTPAFLTGDFNANQDTEAYRTIANSGVLSDSFGRTMGRKNPNWYTFNGYTYREFPHNSNRIDHVFVTTGGTRVLLWEIVKTDYDEKFPSDHFPVVIQWQFEK